LFPAHFVGREREHLHKEKLANLGAIQRPFGFKVSALPIKITGGSAGWVRPVAIAED
jgi:kynurenine formamidase